MSKMKTLEDLLRMLEPCPFHDKEKYGPPYIASWSDDPKSDLQHAVAQVRCDCGASGPERYGVQCKELAVEAWNSRGRKFAGNSREVLKEIMQRLVALEFVIQPELRKECLNLRIFIKEDEDG